MRNMHYENYSFRLSEKTNQKLRALKKDTQLSWNLIFRGLYKHGQKKLKKELEKKQRK